MVTDFTSAWSVDYLLNALNQTILPNTTLILEVIFFPEENL